MFAVSFEGIGEEDLLPPSQYVLSAPLVDENNAVIEVRVTLLDKERQKKIEYLSEYQLFRFPKSRVCNEHFDIDSNDKKSKATIFLSVHLAKEGETPFKYILGRYNSKEFRQNYELDSESVSHSADSGSDFDSDFVSPIFDSANDKMISSSSYHKRTNVGSSTINKPSKQTKVIESASNEDSSQMIEFLNSDSTYDGGKVSIDQNKYKTLNTLKKLEEKPDSESSGLFIEEEEYSELLSHNQPEVEIKLQTKLREDPQEILPEPKPQEEINENIPKLREDPQEILPEPNPKEEINENIPKLREDPQEILPEPKPQEEINENIPKLREDPQEILPEPNPKEEINENIPKYEPNEDNNDNPYSNIDNPPVISFDPMDIFPTISLFQTIFIHPNPPPIRISSLISNL